MSLIISYHAILDTFNTYENAGEAPNYKREFPLTETNVNSGPEAMPYDVNENRASYSSMQSPVLSSSASRGNSFSR